MKTLSLLGCAALAVVVAGVAYWNASPVDVATNSEPCEGSAFEAPTAQLDRACSIRPGARLAWRLTTQTSATVSTDALGHAGTLQAHNAGTFQSTLQVEGLQPIADGFVLLARLVDADALTVTSAPAISETPFLLKVTSRCEVVGFARHASAPLVSARAQQATVAQLWFRLPQRGVREEGVGENALGAYRAVLARDGEVVQRRILAYERGWAGAELPKVGDAFLAATLGDDGWIESVHGSEEVAQGVFAEARANFAAVRAPVDESALRAASRLQSDYVWEDLLPRVVTASMQRAAPTPSERAAIAALREKPFTEAVREFAASVVAEPNTDAKWRGLARYFEAHPESAKPFVMSMVQPEFPGELKAMGFVAVGHATPPEARDALLEVRNSTSVDPYDRIRATLALVGRADVGVELAQTLRRDASAMKSDPNSAQGFYGRNALLALGMFSALRANEDAAVAGEARAAIGESLSAGVLPSTGTPPIPFQAALGAIGNLGDPADLSAIVELSKHANPDVRAQVPQAMRRLKQSVVAEFTLEWLQRETSPDVKMELYGVIQHQLLDEQTVATEALARQAVKDLAAQPLLLTRQPLVRILGPVAGTYPDVRRALVAQAVREAGTTSGLYSVISQYVPGEEVAVALQEHPSLKGQQRLSAQVAVPGNVGPSTGVTP